MARDPITHLESSLAKGKSQNMCSFPQMGSAQLTLASQRASPQLHHVVGGAS